MTPIYDDDTRRERQAEERERRKARFTTQDAREFIAATEPGRRDQLDRMACWKREHYELMRNGQPCDHVWKLAAMACLVAGHTTMRCDKCGIEICKREGDK